MRVAIIGAGYVGLVSGACFADFGHEVCCIDKDGGKIDGLNEGRMPIWEPGLEALVKANVERKRLMFTKELAEGVKGAGAVFIAVGTPARRGDGHADLTFVFAAVRELAQVIEPGTVVVTKSTVPVGTGDRIEEILREEGVTDVSVANAQVDGPDRWSPGRAWHGRFWPALTNPKLHFGRCDCGLLKPGHQSRWHDQHRRGYELCCPRNDRVDSRIDRCRDPPSTSHSGLCL